jgi:hypothetical protein
MRITPEGTAILAAVNLLGWDEADVQVAQSGVPAATTIEMRNRRFSDEVPPIVVTLQQLGVQGGSGVWSVISMTTPLIEVGLQGDVSQPALTLVGAVPALYEGATTLAVRLLDGPAVGESLGDVELEGAADPGFALEIAPPPTPDGRAVVLVSLPEATGRSLGALLIVVPTPIGEAEPEPTVDVTGVPPDVAVTAQRIYDAIPARDFDTLASLLDPMTFVFDFDDGGDPIPAWRDDPSVLDLALPILELPAAAPREIEGYGTFFIWPYLVDTDFSAPTEQQLADLHALGYTDADIQAVAESGLGYQGPRLAIDATGLWRNFLTVGE